MRGELLTYRYGLITDCLSEFFKEMRKRDYTHYIDDYFRLNNDFNRRDEIGVRKTFSGLAKLVFPDGQMGKEDVRMLLEYAIEGRRRVKEQLKIMAGIEFIDVNLGYIDLDAPGMVNVIPVPEQAEDTLVPDAPLMPGHVFGIGRSLDGEYAVYKLENKAVSGEGKFQVEGVGSRRAVKDTLNAAFQQFRDNAALISRGMGIDSHDYLLFFSDLQRKGLSLEVSLAEFVGLCSAAAGRPVLGGLVVPGILRLSGTLEPVADLEDVLRVAKNAGATRILLPMSSIADLQSVSTELVGSVSPIFYDTGDAVSAATRALGV